MDIFTGPVGSANTPQQIHDYAPEIPPSGLFWTMPLHPDTVRVEFNSARAFMHAEGLSVPDAHDLANSLTHGQGLVTPTFTIPPIAPVPAMVSFDVEWSDEISRETVVNQAQNFRGEFIKTGSMSGQLGRESVRCDPDCRLMTQPARRRAARTRRALVAGQLLTPPGRSH
jgi:hypothetical protein